MSYNEFYPVCNSINTTIFWPVGFLLKIEGHLTSAKNGNREAESKLCNRIGQLRRHISSVNDLPEDLQAAVKESVDWLRSQGRVIKLGSKDPREWISARGGMPRW